MTADLTWIPETIITLLEKSESHYRSVGFRRAASHMKQTLQLAKARNTIPADFYPKYVSVLKDDVRDFFSHWEMGPVSKNFTDSMIFSINRLEGILEDLDEKSKTPTFSGSTTHEDDTQAVNEYIERNGGIYDPLALTADPYEALELMDSFYEVVYNHIYIPGKEYIVTQLELAEGHDSMLPVTEEILSVNKVLRLDGQVVSDFAHAFKVPGSFTADETAWVVSDECVVPVEAVARWPLFMYYKVPILTAMLPIHNVKFFNLVQESIGKQSELIQKAMR